MNKISMVLILVVSFQLEAIESISINTSKAIKTKEYITIPINFSSNYKLDIIRKYLTQLVPKEDNISYLKNDSDKLSIKFYFKPEFKDIKKSLKNCFFYYLNLKNFYIKSMISGEIVKNDFIKSPPHLEVNRHFIRLSKDLSKVNFNLCYNKKLLIDPNTLGVNLLNLYDKMVMHINSEEDFNFLNEKFYRSKFYTLALILDKAAKKLLSDRKESINLHFKKWLDFLKNSSSSHKISDIINFIKNTPINNSQFLTRNHLFLLYKDLGTSKNLFKNEYAYIYYLDKILNVIFSKSSILLFENIDFDKIEKELVILKIKTQNNDFSILVNK